MTAAFVALSLAAGGLLAVQAGANTQLSTTVRSPYAAATLQLVVGALLLLAIALATGSLGALGVPPGKPWWHWAGGTASALYVLATILLVPRLGAVATVGLFIAGQMLASLVLDTFGLIGVTPRGSRLVPMLGVAVVLGGAVLIVLGQERDALGRRALGWIALALLAGAVLPVQGAVNALLRQDLGAAFAVGLVSFVVAALTMALALALTLTRRDTPRPQLDELPTMPWWAWLGGFAGAIYVTTMFIAMPAIGAAPTVGLTVAGQQVASLFVDAYGWFRLPKRPVSHLRLAGVVLLLAGVSMIATAS